MSDGLQIIRRWPQKLSNTIADAFPCLHFALKAVNLASEQKINSIHVSTKMGQFQVQAALPHKMCLGGGRNEKNGPTHIRINLMID
jgi:hypothetical protein